MSQVESSSPPVRIDRILVVVSAVVAALIVSGIALLFLDHPLTFGGQQPGRVTEVTFGPVVFVSTLAGIAGWVTLFLLERFTKHGKVLWTWIASAVLALSLVPLVVGQAEPGTRVTLVVLHLLVGGILIVGLRRTAER